MDAPIAVTSDGTVLNITHLGYSGDPLEALRQVLADGHRVFLGVVIPTQLRRELERDIHDVLADAVGRAAPKIRRGRARR